MDPIALLFAIPSSLEAKLTAEMTMVFAPAGMEREKLPSGPVLVPTRVPLMVTEAPAIGAPVESNTVPETVRFCAATRPSSNRVQQRKMQNFLINDNFGL